MADTELIDHTGRTVFRGTQKPPGGGSIPLQSGTGPPGPDDSNVTPEAVGALYVDTFSGGVWAAGGSGAGPPPTSADWIAIGGTTASGTDTYPGVSSRADDARLTAALVTLTDAFVGSGFGNRLAWQLPGADGSQFLVVQLGSAGQFTHFWGSDGTYNAGNGIIFPTADPLVAGAWWDNAGVLTKSAGPPP